MIKKFISFFIKRKSKKNLINNLNRLNLTEDFSNKLNSSVDKKKFVILQKIFFESMTDKLPHAK